MTILTHEQIHRRDWMACPRCHGEKQKPGWTYGTCDNAGEISRHDRREANVWFGYTEAVS